MNLILPDFERRLTTECIIGWGSQSLLGDRPPARTAPQPDLLDPPRPSLPVGETSWTGLAHTRGTDIRTQFTELPNSRLTMANIAMLKILNQ